MYKNTKFIAEIGSNHNNSLERIEELIKQSKKLGFWGVKFQLFEAEKLYKDVKTQEKVKQSQLNVDFIPKIKELCDKYDIKFGCTPFYLEGVDILNEYVDFFKISSFDIKRLDLIKKILQTNKKLFVSLGLADSDDYINILKMAIYDKDTPTMQKDNLIFMHCVSGYPVMVGEAGMSRIYDLKTHLMGLCGVGYSDHTRNISVILTALFFRVPYIELHVDLNDGKGAEYVYEHCWSMMEVEMLKHFFDEMTLSESEFVKKNFHLLADPITGLRG